MEQLHDLPNIGLVAEEKLRSAGIHTPEMLCELGSEGAFLRVREKVDPDACLSMLYGLEGAIQRVRWHALSTEKKQELKRFYEKL